MTVIYALSKGLTWNCYLFREINILSRQKLVCIKDMI